jgi:hypothetical protein
MYRPDLWGDFETGNRASTIALSHFRNGKPDATLPENALEGKP